MTKFFSGLWQSVRDKKVFIVCLPLVVYECLLVLICGAWAGAVYVGLADAKSGAVLYVALIVMTVLYSWQVWRIATGKSRFSALFHRWWKP
jgi:hypothetical protein